MWRLLAVLAGVLALSGHLVLVEQEQLIQAVAVAVVYTMQDLELLAAMVVLVW